jgi:Arc/MetJ family transcription regulator
MRTNIEIDDKLLKAAMKFTKLSTKKDVVNFALTQVVKSHKRKLLLSLQGKVKWEGNLDEMRTYDKWEDNRH